MSSTRDYSLFSLFTAGLACFAPLASAYTKPVGAEPKGNPFLTPGLHDVVPVNQHYGVTWKPSNTSSTVTLVLLKGPSTNAEPQYPIAQGIANHGLYDWIPSKDLAPSDGDTGYGIQLIDDNTGEYQYTTQFGISNPHYSPKAAAHATTPSWGQGPAHPTGYPSGSWPKNGTTNGTAPYPTGGAHGGHAYPTGAPSWATKNVTMATPKPTMHKTTSTDSASATGAVASASPSSVTGGAAGMAASSFVGLVVAAGVAVFAL